MSGKMARWAPAVVRIGIALVILWFGSQQLMHTNAWVDIIPGWATAISGQPATILVLMNGSGEIIIGILLLLGLFTRITGFLSAIHLLMITFIVGYGSIGVRDFGLSMGAISSFLYGPDFLCLDNYLLARVKKSL